MKPAVFIEEAENSGGMNDEGSESDDDYDKYLAKLESQVSDDD
jgi:hypothetical protein